MDFCWLVSIDTALGCEWINRQVFWELIWISAQGRQGDAE
jgi:hypothetical protein